MRTDDGDNLFAACLRLALNYYGHRTVSGKFWPPPGIVAIACTAIITAAMFVPVVQALCAQIGDRVGQVTSAAGRSEAVGAAAALARPLPDGVRVPSYSPGPLPFRPGQQLIYQGSWIGIPAAGGKVVLHPDRDDPALLSAEIWISTNRLTDKFYKMRDYLREDFAAASLKPAEMNIFQNEGHRHDTFNVTFDHRDHVVTLVKHGPRGAQTRKFLSYNPSGPVSGAMMALSQPLEAGDSLSFDSFSGTTRYIFEFKVIRRERIGTPLGEFDAFRIVPSVTYLSDGKINDEVHDTTLWVSADARRLPLRVESAVFIGSVRIDLVKVIDAPSSDGSAAQQAQPWPMLDRAPTRNWEGDRQCLGDFSAGRGRAQVPGQDAVREVIQHGRQIKSPQQITR